ncbi:hypothetical protein VTL71DRAFT_10076 [Oculimacula yallundae]|uniref:Uncharacterized protein n=1 Tax=Oculimacula yallundae TaxID=86028 RepID=A0ABR4BQA3_9HELO
MPTATSLSGYDLLNIGPATTTFTAPASCATAYRTMVAREDFPQNPLYNVHCPWQPPADCNPSGSVVQSLISSARVAEATDHDATFFIPYQSPGIFCPSGQTTAGVAEKLNPTSYKVSGVFNMTFDTDESWNYPVFQPYLDVFVSALEPGETAILCCPSSYTAAPGNCYSAIPTSVFMPTTGCARMIPGEDIGTISGTFTFGGQVFTGGALTITGTIPYSTRTTSIERDEASSYVGVAVEEMGLLVHQSSDLKTASVTSLGSNATALITPTASTVPATSTAPTSSSTTSTSSALHVKGNGRVLAVLCLLLGIGASLVV